MHTTIPARIAWFLTATLALWLITPGPARALTYYWGTHPDKERLVLDFDRGIPDHALSRTDRQSLTLTLPDNFWRTHQRPGSKDFAPARFLRDVAVTDSGLRIDLRTDAFGYIHFSMDEDDKVVIDIFPDPLGTRWKPAAASQTPRTRPEPEPAPRSEAAARPVASDVRQLESPSPQTSVPASDETSLPEASVSDAPSEETAVSGEPPRDPEAAPDYPDRPKPGPSVAENETVSPQAVLPPPDDSPEKKSFFSVPYTFRSAINRGGPEDWGRDSEPGLPQPDSVGPDGGEIRTALRPQSGASFVEEASGGGVKLALNTGNASQAPEGVSEPDRSQPAPAASTADQAAPGGTSAASPASAGSGQDDPTEGPAPQQAAQAPATSPAETDEQGQVLSGEEIRTRISFSETPPAVPGESTGGPTERAEGERAEAAMPEPSPLPAEDAESGRELAEVAGQAAGQAEEGAPSPVADTFRGAEPNAEDMTREDYEALLVERARQILETQERELTPEEKAALERDQIRETLLAARVSLNNEEFAKAIADFESLRRRPGLSDEQREEVLYSLGDAYWAYHKNDLAGNFSKITDAYREAMNFFPDSDKVPSALLRMGLINLRVDNTREAEAYFNILKKRYPFDDNIPLTYYYWGDYYFAKGQFQKAADQFQYVVQQYPDSRFVREAGVGLARSLNKLGYDRQAYEIVDYIEKRWPRFYAQYPPILRLMADVSYRLKEFDKAKLDYWTYYNLDPQGEDTDIILARIGDIYLRQGKKDPAREVYQEAATRFPDKDGGLVAQMRLAEESINDRPSISGMFSVFDRPFNARPLDVYTRIIEEFPDSELAPLAQLKLAMWHLWNRDYGNALAGIDAFEAKHPDNPLIPRAREVALQAFDAMAESYVNEENYTSIIDLWDGAKSVRAQAEDLSPASKVAVALSFWKKEKPDEALEILEPFFTRPKVKEYSDMALHLALSIFLSGEAWDRIVDLSEKIELWHLDKDTRREHDFALALAYENLGRSEDARPLWRPLSEDPDLEPEKKPYPFYFIARSARENRDLKPAYDNAQQALAYFMQMQPPDREKVKEMLGLLMDVSESSGRVAEALTWAEKYREFVEPEDADWPSLQYRRAQLYRKAADMERWRELLTDLSDRMPGTLYGRMAASELETYRLEQNARQYTPTNSL